MSIRVEPEMGHIIKNGFEMWIGIVSKNPNGDISLIRIFFSYFYSYTAAKPRWGNDDESTFKILEKSDNCENVFKYLCAYTPLFPQWRIAWKDNNTDDNIAPQRIWVTVP